MPQIETRFIAHPKTRPHVEQRGGGDAGGEVVEVLTGYGAVFHRADDPATEFRIDSKVVEVVNRRAFDKAVTRDNVRGTYEHRDLLGTTENGTVRLSIDDIGLRYEIDLPPTTAGKDVAALVRRGDLRGSSFSFSADEADGGRDEIRKAPTGDGWVRELMDVPVFDIGPVVFEAYEGTSAKVRSLPPAELRSMFARAREQRGTGFADVVYFATRAAMLGEQAISENELTTQLAEAAGLTVEEWTAIGSYDVPYVFADDVDARQRVEAVAAVLGCDPEALWAARSNDWANLSQWQRDQINDAAEMRFQAILDRETRRRWKI